MYKLIFLRRKSPRVNSLLKILLSLGYELKIVPIEKQP